MPFGANTNTQFPGSWTQRTGSLGLSPRLIRNSQPTGAVIRPVRVIQPAEEFTLNPRLAYRPIGSELPFWEQELELGPRGYSDGAHARWTAVNKLIVNEVYNRLGFEIKFQEADKIRKDLRVKSITAKWPEIFELASDIFNNRLRSAYMATLNPFKPLSSMQANPFQYDKKELNLPFYNKRKRSVLQAGNTEIFTYS